MQRAPQSGEPIANEDSSQEDVLFCGANMHHFPQSGSIMCAPGWILMERDYSDVMIFATFHVLLSL